MGKKETDSRKHTENTLATGADAGLVALFLKMTPEERVQSNDNAINTIMELRNAFAQSRSSPSDFGGNTAAEKICRKFEKQRE